MRFGGSRIKLFALILVYGFLLNCNADLQAADFTFAEWTITSDFLPEGQPVTAEKMRDLQERLDLTVVGTTRV